MEQKKQKKYPALSKGKMKRTIKNVLCRPDPLFWPDVSQEHIDIVETALKQYKIEKPDFQKPNWNTIKHLPKTKRPRPPKLKSYHEYKTLRRYLIMSYLPMSKENNTGETTGKQLLGIRKVDGLIFGMNDCKNAINNHDCSAIIIESAINPRAIVQPLIETCVSSEIPILCVNGLKKITSTCFGIPTSCLGLQNNLIEDLKSTILDIAKSYKPQKIPISKGDDENMELDDTEHMEPFTKVPSQSPYLYRNSKKMRIFNPSLTGERTEKAFIGQDFIKLSANPEQKSDRKAYMTMILKRIANNQNRETGKKKDNN